MQKTCYRIKNNQIDPTDDMIEKPQSMLQTLSDIESGRVYQMMLSDKNTLSQNKDFDDLLIYIIKQEVKINDQPHVMTLFKDITFGVLFEQIKAKQQLQNVIEYTVYKNITDPLREAFETCRSLTENNEFQEF